MHRKVETEQYQEYDDICAQQYRSAHQYEGKAINIRYHERLKGTT